MSWAWSGQAEGLWPQPPARDAEGLEVPARGTHPGADRRAHAAPEPHDDEELVVGQAVRGDEEAFTILFDRYFPLVFRYARAHVDAADAEDLAQDAFAKAWRALGSYRQYGVPFRSWLLTIAHNLVIDSYRRRGRSARLVQDACTAHRVGQGLARSEGVDERVCRRLTVREALERLNPEYRRVLLLKYQAGLDYSEMARVLGKRDSNVRTLVYRALKQLRRAVATAP